MRYKDKIARAMALEAITLSGGGVNGLASQLSNISYSIESFGAIPNVATFDNIPAIQATVNFVNGLGGGTVYIPQGKTYWINPTLTSFITLNNNITILGGDNSTLKVFANNGDFIRIFYSLIAHNKVQFKDVIFDNNIQNNLTCDIELGTSPQFVIETTLEDSLKVNNCKFVNQGGTNIIVVTGGYDTAYFEVVNCEFDFVRGLTKNMSAGVYWYDVSLIYCDCFIANIKNNRFISSTVPLQNANTCIEQHGTILNLSNNFIQGFSTAVLTLIASLSTNYAYMDWNINNNVIADCLNGIVLETFTNTNALAIYKNIDIKNNSITITPALFGQNPYCTSMGGQGIEFNANYKTTIFDGIIISGNIITFQSDPIVGIRTENVISNDIGIRFFGGYAYYKNVYIEDNKLINIPSYGILMSPNSGVYPLKNIFIRRNSFVNVGCGLSPNFASNKTCINISSSAVVYNVIINANILIDEGTPANTNYFFTTNSVSNFPNASNLLFRKDNIILSSFGSPGTIPRMDSGANKGIFEWTSIYYTNDKVNNIVQAKTNDIMITPYRAYRISGDGVTGSLLTSTSTTVTASITSGTTLLTVNDSTNIKAGYCLKISDGTNSMYVFVDYVSSLTSVVLDANATFNFNSSNAVIAYNLPGFKDIYNDNYGTIAPTTGTWFVGDKVYNSAPTATGYLGFVCITAGTPGIWKGFGLIQA
jgi:hypothetical protein